MSSEMAEIKLHQVVAITRKISSEMSEVTLHQFVAITPNMPFHVTETSVSDHYYHSLQ